MHIVIKCSSIYDNKKKLMEIKHLQIAFPIIMYSINELTMIFNENANKNSYAETVCCVKTYIEREMLMLFIFVALFWQP